jgi:leucyl aminopeptidase
VLLEAQRFDGKKPHASAILPRGNDFEVVSAVKDAAALSPWCLAALADKLPDGTYRVVGTVPKEEGTVLAGDCPPLTKAALGWLLAQHRFDEYRSKKDDAERGPRILVTGEPARIDETVRLAEATALVRDLVNTPAADMGPAELEAAAADLARRSGAQLNVTSGAELADGYPLIAAVGAAATPERAPRLIELEWG